MPANSTPTTIVGATAPALIIRLELEGAPSVYVDTANRHEEARLTQWLAETRPEYGALAARALVLARRRVA
jgi:hypothetical protein